MGQNNVFIKKIVSKYACEWCGTTFNWCTISVVPVRWLSSSVHVAPASRTAGHLFPWMLDLDRDVYFSYGGRGLLDGRWQHCITTVNISLYTWVYKCHIHECIWQNKGECLNEQKCGYILNVTWRYIRKSCQNYYTKR